MAGGNRLDYLMGFVSLIGGFAQFTILERIFYG